MTTSQERLDTHTRDRLRALVPTRLKPFLRRFKKRARILRYRDWRVRFVDPERNPEAIRRRLLRLSGAAENGIGWALRELQRDSITAAEDLLSACYKGPWALALAGRVTEARSLLE